MERIFPYGVPCPYPLGDVVREGRGVKKMLVTQMF